jgi:hypothetical protein
MKFEKPIAEIQKFDLKDIISASDEEQPTQEDTTESQPGTAYYSQGIPCTWTKEDNYNFSGHCL